MYQFNLNSDSKDTFLGRAITTENPVCNTKNNDLE